MRETNVALGALGSRLIDYGLVFAATAGVQAATSATIGVPSAEWFLEQSWLLSAWVMATMSLPMWIYNTATVAGPQQATLGLRMVGLSVESSSGSSISIGTSLLRSAFMFLAWELANIAMFVPENFALSEPHPWQYIGLIAANLYLITDIVVIIATGGRRSIADFVAGTRLVQP